MKQLLRRLLIVAALGAAAAVSACRHGGASGTDGAPPATDAGCSPAEGCSDAAEPPSCENPPTTPMLPPEAFGECCVDARCVNLGLLPAGAETQFAMCDATGVCVPEVFFVTDGFFTLPSCTSIAGSEGRCMSTCLPDIAAQMDYLPVDVCDPNDRCAPCCNPLTGEDTGACSQGCDVGPAGVCAPAFPACCDDLSGHCIPPELVPDDQESNFDTCAAGGLCVPDVLQDPAFEGSDCIGSGFTGDYVGVCMPDCLNITLEFTLDASPCALNYVCVPCEDPLGNPTGAPGCP